MLIPRQPERQEDMIFAKRTHRALAGLVERCGRSRSSEKSNPLYYARLTVKKAKADMGRESLEATSMRESEK